MGGDSGAMRIAAMIMAGMAVTMLYGFGPVGALLIGGLFADIAFDDDGGN